MMLDNPLSITADAAVDEVSLRDVSRRIYDEWNAGFNEQNMDRVLALYAEDAIIETPAVLSIYPDAKDGILRGKQAIRQLFDKNVAAFSGSFRALYRNGLFFANGKYLTWEYPRVTPQGTQVDLFESMDISEGLIVYHRVYWGWQGMLKLIENRNKKK